MPQRDGAFSQGQSSVAGVLERAAESAPVLGTPVRVWHAAREETEKVASTLPDCCGLDQVKQFVRRHPVISTLAVLGLGYVVLGGTLPVIGGILAGRRS